MLKNAYIIKLNEESDKDEYLKKSDYILNAFNLDKDKFYLQDIIKSNAFTVFYISEKEYNPKGFFYINIHLFDDKQIYITLKFNSSVEFSDIETLPESKEEEFKHFVEQNFCQFIEIEPKRKFKNNPFNYNISFGKRKNKNFDIEDVLENLKEKLILAGIDNQDELEERLSNHRTMAKVNLNRSCIQNYTKKYLSNDTIKELKDFI